MGSLVQQINLYRGNQSANGSTAQSRGLLLAGLGALVLVLVLAGAGELYLQQVASDRETVAQRLNTRQTELASFKSTLTPRAVDPHLESELSRLRETRDRINANLAAIAQHADSASGGFSDYFSGLARNTLDGLWLNNVAVSAGGSEMRLKGQAIEPELVPQLLRTLAAEQAFAGRAFRKVTFERRELKSGEVVEFELRSAESGGPGDAG